MALRQKNEALHQPTCKIEINLPFSPQVSQVEEKKSCNRVIRLLEEFSQFAPGTKLEQRLLTKSNHPQLGKSSRLVSRRRGKASHLYPKALLKSMRKKSSEL